MASPSGTTRRRFLIRTGCGLAAAYGGGHLTVRPAYAASAPHVHDTAALVAAQVSPEPFRSHWRACRGGSWPDYMRDQPAGPRESACGGPALHPGSDPLSSRSSSTRPCCWPRHGAITWRDSSCIAHAYVWKPRAAREMSCKAGEPGRGVWSFLPAHVRDYSLPFREANNPWLRSVAHLIRRPFSGKLGIRWQRTQFVREAARVL